MYIERMIERMIRMLPALALGLLVAAGGAWAQTAAPPPKGGQPAPSLDEVVKALETNYGRINDLKADFEQTAFNKSLNQSIPAQGTVYLKKGGKLRWEYAEPTPQQIVSDGKTVWIYTPALAQVNVGPAPEALAGPAGSFLAGLGRVREHFGVRFLNPAEPRDRAVVYDQFENTVTMHFRKTAVNSGLADSLFTFVAPKGVATVPLR